jgi:hypothetical protein
MELHSSTVPKQSAGLYPTSTAMKTWNQCSKYIYDPLNPFYGQSKSNEGMPHAIFLSEIERINVTVQ